MDTKLVLVFTAGFLVLLVIIFFVYVKWLHKYFDSLINKGVIYYNVREKRDLNTISFIFITVLILSFVVGYLLG